MTALLATIANLINAGLVFSVEYHSSENERVAILTYHWPTDRDVEAEDIKIVGKPRPLSGGEDYDSYNKEEDRYTSMHEVWAFSL